MRLEKANADKDMSAVTHWECRPFEELDAAALHSALELRAAVFVVEQECAYQDPDGADRNAIHHLGWAGERLIAYQRCLPPDGDAGSASAIGRIVVHADFRGGSLGRELVQRAIDFNFSSWPGHAIVISAQSHLERFYESMGFVICSERYLEDGIPHTEMRLEAPALSGS